MRSCAIIVIDFWCRGQSTLIVGIKRDHCLLKELAVKKAGWKSLLVDDKEKEIKDNEKLYHEKQWNL